MSKDQRPIELFMPPNILKAKVGGSISGLDPDAVKRAEQALTGLKADFGRWINADVERLVNCRDAFLKDGGEESQRELYLAAFDLRSQALTFEFPLAGRVAGSLCRLLDGMSSAGENSLMDAHVAAIRIIVRDGIKAESDKTALLLIEELESRVAEVLGSAVA